VQETFRQQGLQVLGAIIDHLSNLPQLKACFGSRVAVGSSAKYFSETRRVSKKYFVARLIFER
jgi:hypothetical protein